MTRRPPSGSRSRGQSLTEFALILPVLLLILLFGIDFGRVFLGWINLNNVAKVAANYAAMNPTASWTAGSEYQTLIANDMAGINCTTTTPYPAPTFAGGTNPGANVKVTIGCNFKLLTPFLDIIIADPVAVTGSSAFPIRSGILPGETLVPVGPTLPPTPSPTASPVPTPSPTPGITPTPTPTATPTATPAPTPTPIPMCTVPDFMNDMATGAQAKWTAAGFTSNVVFSQLVPPDFQIKKQDLKKNDSYPCLGTTITLSSK